MFLFNLLTTKIFGFVLLLLENDGASASFAVYEVKTSLTLLGWAMVVVFPTALIFGAIYLIVKFIKKSKLK